MSDLIGRQMDDLISRRAAIDALVTKTYRHTYLGQILDIIKDLPSAQPDRRHGRWEWGGEWDDGHNKLVRCSVCDAADLQADGVIVPYCWHCGAEMEPYEG